eukprot:scaffold42687_cov144-Skeletonema_dohrnii-CCMP3373.AAC.2
MMYAMFLSMNRSTTLTIDTDYTHCLTVLAGHTSETAFVNRVLIVPRSDERCKEQSIASSVPAILRDTIVKNGEGYHVQSTVCSACYNLVGDLMRSKKLGCQLCNSQPQIENGYLNIGSALQNH